MRLDIAEHPDLIYGNTILPFLLFDFFYREKQILSDLYTLQYVVLYSEERTLIHLQITVQHDLIYPGSLHWHGPRPLPQDLYNQKHSFQTFYIIYRLFCFIIQAPEYPLKDWRYPCRNIFSDLQLLQLNLRKHSCKSSVSKIVIKIGIYRFQICYPSGN